MQWRDASAPGNPVRVSLSYNGKGWMHYELGMHLIRAGVEGGVEFSLRATATRPELKLHADRVLIWMERQAKTTRTVFRSISSPRNSTAGRHVFLHLN